MKEFNEQQSLAIIHQMIEEAKDNIRKGSADSVIFYGWAVAIISFSVIIASYLLQSNLIDVNYSFFLWLLMIPACIINRFQEARMEKEVLYKTHIDCIIKNVWQSFLYSIILFLTIIFVLGYGLKMYQLFIIITPCILIMCGLSMYITAKACKFSPFIFGSTVMWIGALLCILLTIILRTVFVQFVVLATSMILGFVIPGIKLKKQVNV